MYTSNTPIANVTVLIPPAVPAGEPPININTHIINFVEGCKLAMSTEANPAVLRVADWKKEICIWSNRGSPPIVLILLNSHK